MRTITTHKVNEVNEGLDITVMDKPGHGGACHDYRVTLLGEGGVDVVTTIGIQFQNGPVGEVGVNGLTHEALLAILIDRLDGFQGGAYACQENATALNALRVAQAALHSRTAKRIERGVEGTHTI